MARELEAFRAALETTLRARRWSLSQLGREAGIQPSVISRWLNAPQGAVAASRPSPRNLQKLAPVLGVPYEDLMRICGYLPRTGHPPPVASIDPDLAAVTAAWPNLDDGIRRAIRILVLNASAVLIKLEPAPLEGSYLLAPAA